MSYIGNKPATSFETVQKQISTSNSGTTITLDRAVTSVQDILLTIDAVVQSYDNYSVSGTTLTVGGTLNNNRVEILYVGRTMQSVDPTDDSVSAAKIKTDAVTTAKVQNDAITVDKLNLISTSSVPSLEAKGDGSSQDGYIQLNCSQNSHGVKIKSPPHSANQSYTLTLPSTAPATNKIMQTDSSGNLSFIDTPSGLWVKLGDTSYTSNTSSITFDNVFSSTYRVYKVHMKTATSNSNEQVKIRLRSGSSGSNADINDSNYNYKRWFNGQDLDDGSNSYNRSNGRLVSYFQVAAQGHTGANHKPMQIDMTIQDPGDHLINNSGRVNFTYIADFYDVNNLSYSEMGSCFYNGNTDATGITFEMTAGSYGYGNILLYGLKP